MRMKYLALAAGALLISGGAASAATVTNSLHLRSGPGTHYRVVATMPAGAHVRIRNCTSSWCRVSFRGESGWASANYIAQYRGHGRRSYRARYRTYRTYRTAPAYGAYAEAPGYYGHRYYGDRYDEGPGFDIGFGPGGFGFGIGPGYGWDGD